ncbi:hypothetical protein KCV06_g376, partial [Aureobasidium melanogenum]
MQIRGWKDYRRWTGIPVASRTILVSESTRVEKALLRILALDSYRAAIIRWAGVTLNVSSFCRKRGSDWCSCCSLYVVHLF